LEGNMKKIIILVAILIGILFIFSGCGGPARPTDSVSDKSNVGDQNQEDRDDFYDDVNDEEYEDYEISIDEVNTDFQNFSDYCDYWNAVYATNDKAITAFGGLEIIQLMSPGLTMAMNCVYDILNLYDENGRFEGKLLLSSYEGYIDKNSSQIDFGYEHVVSEEEALSEEGIGDKKVEKGTFYLKERHLISDNYTERDGKKIDRTVSEFKVEKDGSISVIEVYGRKSSSSERLSTSYLFVRNGENRYDFVIANSEIGPEFNQLSLEDDMTKEKAIELFEKAGATIESSGGIKDGVLALD